MRFQGHQPRALTPIRFAAVLAVFGCGWWIDGLLRGEDRAAEAVLAIGFGYLVFKLARARPSVEDEPAALEQSP